MTFFYFISIPKFPSTNTYPLCSAQSRRDKRTEFPCLCPAYRWCRCCHHLSLYSQIVPLQPLHLYRSNVNKLINKNTSRSSFVLHVHFVSQNKLIQSPPKVLEQQGKFCCFMLYTEDIWVSDHKKNTR